MLDAILHFRAYLTAGAAALAAARRIDREFDRRAFDDTVAWLRKGADFPPGCDRPLVHLRVVNRLLRWLPPRSMGPCLKRSLILLHLWSRCGVEPVLHLGFADDGENRWRGHAWLTAEQSGEPLTAGGPDGHREAFTY